MRIPSPCCLRKPKAKRGWALLFTLWIASGVIILTLELVFLWRCETRIATAGKEAVSVAVAAEAGLTYAVAWFRQPAPMRDATFLPDRTGAMVAKLTFQELPVQISVRSLDGKISLNGTSEQGNGEVLKRLFQSLGIDGSTLPTALDCFDDWRDADHEHRLNGAESSDYEQRTPSYVARDGALRSTDELFLIKNFDYLNRKEALTALRERCTVWGTSPRINLNDATAETLAALPGFDEPQVRRIQEARETAPLTGEKDLENLFGPDLARTVAPYVTFQELGLFEVVSRCQRPAGGVQVERRMTVLLQAGAQGKVKIYATE